MELKTITGEEYLRHEKYYRQMLELHPDRFAIVIDKYGNGREVIKEPLDLICEENETQIEEPPPRKKCRRKTDAAQRKKALDRDRHRCQICGAENDLEVHHLKHREDGGTDELENLVTLCASCHAEQHEGERIYNLMVSRLEVLK